MDETRSDKFIPAAAADKLIAAHDGDVALLYLFLLRNGGGQEEAAAALCRTLREIGAAWEKLERMGLLPGAAPAPRPAETPAVPAPPEEPRLPEYRAEDIVRRSKEDGTFSVILDEAAKVIGHSLSGSDMKLLFGIYDYLALPPEVILVMLNYCAELCAQRYGPRRRPSARFIEKEAYVWVNREIMTLEQAEDYIRQQKERHSGMNRIKDALGIRDRELSATEAKYVASWLELGFDEQAAAIAYDRTVTNTGSLKWSYMNKIFLSWHEKGLHTPQEIEAGDGRRRRSGQASPSRPEEPKKIDMDELRSILDKI